MKCREFTSFVGIGMGISALPAALTACDTQTKDKSSTDAAVSGDGFEEVGRFSQLEQTGQIFNDQLANGTALVIKDPTNAEKLIAVNPTCSHAGCAVSWESDQQIFLCPCHDSEFSSTGKVLEGPATEPLAGYQVKLKGDAILVKST